MRILFISPEGLPFSKTGGLADVIEGLPKALVELGHEVAVVLPRYRGTRVNKVLVPSLTIPLGPVLRFPAIADGTVVNGVRYFFVDDPEYFDREQLYGVQGVDYPDNAERFAEFSRAALEVAKQVWPADVLHCHDWQAALVPVLLKTVYAPDPAFRHVPTILTVHNLGYHGLFPRDVLARVGLPETLFHIEALEFFGKVNYLKGGLLFADWITTVSRRYAQEIQTPEYGHGLDGVIRRRADRLVGILNGVDYSAWNPETDPFIVAHYSAKDPSGKRECKRDLLAEFKLPAENLNRPVIGIVSRFVDQKGFDLIAEVADELMEEDLCITALGTGEARYELLFRELAARFPARFAARIAYDNVLAHKIEAGADMFLMPSRYEPSGLNQLYSLKYGTVPIVRATGGLDDTIEPFDPRTGRGNGFKFREYEGRALLAAVREALRCFRDQKAWRRLMLNGMTQDFSWKTSAADYLRLYQQAREARIPRAVGAIQ
ncbi:MAG: glycogen synthase GlgA [Acidobacteriia bacterium]|jgi:starch synthase|nr:glycogen synthase GlgA [Terriglobia bacterium]